MSIGNILFIKHMHLYYIFYRKNGPKSKRDKNIPQCGGTLVNKVQIIKKISFSYKGKNLRTK